MKSELLLSSFPAQLFAANELMILKTAAISPEVWWLIVVWDEMAEGKNVDLSNSVNNLADIRAIVD